MLFVYKSVIFYNVLLIIITDIVLYFPSLTYFHQDGWTPLMHAAGGGHSEVTKILVDAGASIEAKCNVSKTISIFSYVCVCVWISLFFHHTV